MLREAEGQAQAILQVQKATAEGLSFLKEANVDENVLKLKSYEAFTKAADGKATKLIIPSDIAGITSIARAIKETVE